MVIGGLLAYFSFATIFPSPSIVGSFGANLSEINIHIFGFMAYVYGPFLIYGIFSLYKNSNFNTQKNLFLSGILLYFILFLILQAVVFNGNYQGLIGTLILGKTIPLFGFGGFWIFWTTLFLLASFLVAEVTFVEAFHSFVTWLRTVFAKFKKPKNQELTQSEPSGWERTTVAVRPQIKTKNPTDDNPPFFVDENNISLSEDENIANYKIDTAIAVEQTARVEQIEDDAKEQTPKKQKKSKIESATGVEIVKELEENKELLKEIELGSVEKPIGWKLPPADIFVKPPQRKSEINESEIDEKIAELIDKLRRFNIEGDVIRTYTGPVVTTFEFKPAANIKVARILTLQDDIAMALKAQTIRIQAPIPGKDVVGIEIPNKDVQTIYMRELLESDLFAMSQSKLTLILGKDIVGNSFITDLKKLPHLLIAGTTGSGKSVGINAMILSLLYKNSPDELRLMMIDPKMLEFSIYNDIPHLLTPVITKPKQAVVALSNMVSEMERRYQLMSKTKTKNIENYNEKGEKEGFEKLPYIVVIIDELADLMMTSGKDVELSIARLAQMARASGIHLIVATQRPSVNVVTGLIKANLPSRVSFKVGQKIDSKVILDQMGAESLLGRGDMLFTPPGSSGVVRLHAPWSSEGEIEKVVEYLKNLREPRYDESFLQDSSDGSASGGNGDFSDDLDELYEEAKNIVLSERKTSISYIQRRLQIGYNRSARIVEQLENMGVISQADKKGNREIL